MHRPWPAKLERLRTHAVLWVAALLTAGCGDPLPPTLHDAAPSFEALPDVVAALAAGEPVSALARIDEHRARGTAPPGVEHLEGLALMQTGRLDDAETVLSRELVAHPGNAEARWLRAECLLDLGRLDDAAAELDLARRLIPDGPQGFLLGGRLHLGRGDDERAAAAFEAYLAVDRTGLRAIEAHHSLAQIARNAGQLDLATSQQAAAAKLSQAHETLAVQRLRLGEDPRDPQAALAVGMVYLDLFREVAAEPGLLAQAEAALNACLETDPDNPRALFNLGFVALVQGRTGLARARWQATLALDPEHVGATENLRRLEREAGAGPAPPPAGVPGPGASGGG